jgi:hypothetical protein
MLSSSVSAAEPESTSFDCRLVLPDLSTAETSGSFDDASLQIRLDHIADWRGEQIFASDGPMICVMGIACSHEWKTGGEAERNYLQVRMMHHQFHPRRPAYSSIEISQHGFDGRHSGSAVIATGICLHSASASGGPA